VDAVSVLTPERFTALYDRHARCIFQYCARRVGQDAAEDIVGSTFLIAYEHRSRFDAARSGELAWLYGIATNLLRRYRRDEVRAYRALVRTGVDPLDDSHTQRADERIDATATTRRLAGVLAALPHRQRDVLLLYAIAGMQPAEIAVALGAPVGTVRSHLHRARMRLRKVLSEGDE
jgi:RNA polymerase sigma factor (sigma-70 family)